MSGETVVEGAPQATVGGRSDQGAVFVFSEPSGGWSGSLHEIARLTSSSPENGSLGEQVAMSGQSVVATGDGKAYVFTEPASGWTSGVQAATLDLPGGGVASSVAVDGSTIVAAGTTGSAASSSGAVYVFVEPPGGWHGVIQPSGKLTAPGNTAGPGGFPASVAIAGDTVVAGGPSATYVFNEPAGGWGSETPSATLTPSGRSGFGFFDSVATSAGTIVASSALGPVYVFSEPAGGWTGTQHESAELASSDGAAGEGPQAGLAIDGSTVVVTSGTQNGNGSGAYVFEQPSGGWSGVVHESGKLTASAEVGLTAVSLQGPTVVASDQSSLHVFSEQAGGWASESPGATLTASGNPFSGGFSAVGASGTTVVATADYSAAPTVPGMVYVFAEPVGGWTSETQGAKLETSDGDQLNWVAADGRDVFAAGAYSSTAPPMVYVFAEPAGGWRGTVNESATLEPPGNGILRSLAADNGVVVASDGTDAYVFAEPPGGWSGAISPVARLASSSGSPLGAVAISGPTIVASANGLVDVFTEPSDGWSGIVRQTAQLGGLPPYGTVGYSVAISGRTVVTGGAPGSAYVFSEPAGGWRAGLAPSAALTYDASADAGEAVVAVSGRTIALTDFDTHYPCPCPGRVSSYADPPAAGSGTETPTGSLETISNGFSTAGILGPDVFAGESDGVDVLRSVGAPVAWRGSLAGLRTGRPRLGMAIASGQNARGLRAFTVTLPHGLRLANRDLLATAVRVTGPHKLALRAGSLVVTLKRTLGQVSITIAAPALLESQALKRRALDHGLKTQTVLIGVTDAAGHLSHLRLQVAI